MSSHAACTTGFEAMSFRKSAGTVCTAPELIFIDTMRYMVSNFRHFYMKNRSLNNKMISIILTYLAEKGSFFLAPIQLSFFATPKSDPSCLSSALISSLRTTLPTALSLGRKRTREMPEDVEFVHPCHKAIISWKYIMSIDRRRAELTKPYMRCSVKTGLGRHRFLASAKTQSPTKERIYGTFQRTGVCYNQVVNVSSQDTVRPRFSPNRPKVGVPRDLTGIGSRSARPCHRNFPERVSHCDHLARPVSISHAAGAYRTAPTL